MKKSAISSKSRKLTSSSYGLVRKGGFLVFVPKKSLKNFDIVEFIKKEREKRIHQFFK